MRPRVWLAAGLLAAFSSWNYFFPQAPRLGPLARLTLAPNPGPAIIFSPHSDDEALAAGGLMQRLESRGAQPRVVLVTGGDAFKIAAEAYFRKGVRMNDMLAFGRLRLSESRTALTELGLPPERLTFLGYPDQGLARLWLECWRSDTPCRSTATGARYVPYTEARTQGAPFSGEQLLAELREILRTTRPATVFYPHPNEAHVDHWALSNFVAAALEDLRRTEPDWSPPDEWMYLVHRGDWPAPKGYRPDDDLLPPEKLVGGMTTWHMETLTPEQVERKAAAVRAYRSQTRMLRRYMDSFIRANELFGSIERVLLPADGGRPPLLPTPDSPPWPDLNWVQVITDPRADTVAREVERGADSTGVWAARRGDTLYLSARMAARPRRPVEIRLYARGFSPSSGWGDLACVVITPDGGHRLEAWPEGAGQAEVQTEANGTWVRAAIPLSVLANPASVMVNVETRVDTILIDRSAWRPLALDGR